MNIYHIVLKIADVKSRRNVNRCTKGRNQEERSAGRNGYTDSGTTQFYQRNGTSRNNRGFGQVIEDSSISLRFCKSGIASLYGKAWQKSKNFLTLLSLFFMPYIIPNLTYFMLLDFSVCGYDIQMLNNIGVY